MNRVEYSSNANINNYANMINDRWRNEFFYNALKKHAAGKVVLDVGTGTGILAFYALSLGAKFVYCIERHSDSADLAQRILSKHFDQTKFKVILGNFWTSDIDNQIDQKIDILVSETIGPGLFDQGMIHTWHCAKPFLAESAISIPDRLHFDVWVWDGDNALPLPRVNECELFLSEVIDEDYAKALAEVNRELHAEQSVKSLEVNFRWETINAVKIEPTVKHYDVLSYTLNKGPKLQFTSLPDPEHIIPEISFELEVHQPSTVAIVNKMSFESDVRYIKDAFFMPWKKNPVCGLPSGGKYKFEYNNPDLKHSSNRHCQEWHCNIN